jgi:hypothetical protein
VATARWTDAFGLNLASASIARELSETVQ